MLFFSLSAIAFNSIPIQTTLLSVMILLLFIAGYKEFHKLILALLPFILFMNIAFLLFLSNARTNIWETITLIDLRILLIFFSFAFFSFTTDLIAIVKLLKKIHCPESIYLSIYIALRFLPELERDFKEIKDLQKLKGITLRNPLKYFKSQFLPLTYIIFDKADELSIAYYLKKKKRRKE